MIDIRGAISEFQPLAFVFQISLQL